MQFSQESRRKALPYILIAPVIVYYSVFWLYPVIRCVIGSFQDSRGNFSFKNYAFIFSNEDFYRACFNTAFIVVFSVALEFVIAFGLALLINKKFKGSGLFLFIAMIPMALPPVAMGAMWSSGLATYGWLNSFLYIIGAIEKSGKIPFLAMRAVSFLGLKIDFAALFLIIFVDAWQVVPFMMIILLAGMQNLNKEFMEAGYIFGAGKLTVLRKITIPLLKPTITTAMILRIISAIQIWLIIVMIYKFRRLPVLVEQLVFFKREVRGPVFFQYSIAYSVLIAVIVSIMAIFYLKVSGSFKEEGN